MPREDPRDLHAAITPAVDASKIEPFAVDVDAKRATGWTERIGRIPMAAYRVSTAVAMPDGSQLPRACSLKFDSERSEVRKCQLALGAERQATPRIFPASVFPDL